jgi:hypothetical protein
MSKPSKKRFTVDEKETINDCLERMEKEGYMPVRRIEEPIFQEVVTNGVKNVEPCGRTIVFEGKLVKTEH